MDEYRRRFILTILIFIINISNINSDYIPTNNKVNNKKIVLVEECDCYETIHDILEYIKCNNKQLKVMNKIVSTALSQWDYKEVEGSQNNPEIVKYFKDIGFNINNDETAWCSAFLNWCAMKSGYEYSKSLMARSWIKLGEEVPKEDWQVGDVVILWRGSKTSWKGHCSLYIRHDDEYVYMLGGNQSNRVTISKYKINRILNVRRLKQIQ